MLGLRDTPSVLSPTVIVPAAEALKGLPCRFVRRETTYVCRVNATCTLFPRDAESAAPEPASPPMHQGGHAGQRLRLVVAELYA